MKIDCHAQSFHAIVGPTNVLMVTRLLLLPVWSISDSGHLAQTITSGIAGALSRFNCDWRSNFLSAKFP